MTDPRDRLQARRLGHHRDPLAAAVSLDLAVDDMRRQLVDRGPEDDGQVTDPTPTAVFDLPPRSDPGPRAGEYGDDAPQEDFPWAPPAGGPLEPRSAGNPAVQALDWVSRHDERSRNYGLRQRLTASAALRPVLLSCGPVLDQGAEGACVGFGCTDASNAMQLAAAPGADLRDGGDALALYREAQRLDDVPGESYSGTSVLAGMKAGQAEGWWGGYLWAFGTRDIAQALLQHATPVVVGVPWRSGMYATGPRGVVRVSGDVVGGHCLAVVGLQLTGPNGEPGVHFIWQNSWGPAYGDEGLGYISNRDLGTLLGQRGEAAIPTPGPA